MKAPMYVRTLSPVEQAGIEAGLRSSHAFTLRRSQILLASSRGQRPAEIARNLGCATQTVSNTIHAFDLIASCLSRLHSRSLDPALAPDSYDALPGAARPTDLQGVTPGSGENGEEPPFRVGT